MSHADIINDYWLLQTKQFIGKNLDGYYLSEDTKKQLTILYYQLDLTNSQQIYKQASKLVNANYVMAVINYKNGIPLTGLGVIILGIIITVVANVSKSYTSWSISKFLKDVGGYARKIGMVVVLAGMLFF
jgi:hypothetical protein